MKLMRIANKIQYQTAKLEVIELLLWHGKNSQPSLETEMAYNMISTIRLNLLNTSEACFEVSLEDTQSSVASLQNTVASATNFLVQMSSGLVNPETIFLKELVTSIVTELVNLNSELSQSLLQPPQQVPTITSDIYPEFEVDRQLKKLIKKCMGDVKQAERLILYEHQRNPKLDRAGAIDSAIMRWEDDNR